MGYHIVLENRLGCELDGRYAATENEISGAVAALAKDSIIADGDVIRVIEAHEAHNPHTANTCPKCQRTRDDFDCAEDGCPMAVSP